MSVFGVPDTMSNTDVQPADAALLRECAVIFSEDAEDARNWGAIEHAHRISTRAARLRALADQLDTQSPPHTPTGRAEARGE